MTPEAIEIARATCRAESLITYRQPGVGLCFVFPSPASRRILSIRRHDAEVVALDTPITLGELLAQAEQDGTTFEVLACEPKSKWISRLKATALPADAENPSSVHACDNLQPEVAARILGKLK